MFVVKECKTCNESKMLSEFHRNCLSLFGVNNVCKLCRLEASKEYYQSNKERIKERDKKYYKSNKDIVRERNKKYYQSNKERLLECQRNYAKSNKERIKERNKEYRQNNEEYLKEYIKRYRQINEEKIKEYNKKNRERINERTREYIQKRVKNDYLFKLRMNISQSISKAIKRNGYTKRSKTNQILGCSFEEFKIHIESQFKKGMSWENYGEWHLDHIYPVSRAKDEQHLIELNHYTNFQPLWAKENLSKGNKIVEKQLKLL